MVVCAGFAALSVWAAIFLEQCCVRSGVRVGTKITLIGATICLFAAFLGVWASIGDRARGRKRCPKCWYDMSRATGLQCPECGKTVKNARRFSKAKHPRWAFLVAALFASSGIYSIVVSERVHEFGAFGAVPTWFLMMGWEHLPEPWIYDNDIVPPMYGCLADRLDEVWTSDARLARFRTKLIRPMGSSKEARWDPKRWTLIDDMYFSDEFETHAWQDLDIGSLFQSIAMDVFEAIINPNPTELDASIKQLLYTGEYDNPYSSVRSWLIQSHEFSYGGYEFNRETVAATSMALQDLQLRMRGEDIAGLLTHKDDDVRSCAFNLVLDAGLMNEFVYSYFDQAMLDMKAAQFDFQFSIGIAMSCVSDETQAGLCSLLAEWIWSDNESKQLLAFMTLNIFQNYADAGNDYKNWAYHKLMQSVQEFARGNDDSSVSDEETKLRGLAARAVAYYDPSGIHSFPIYRRLLITECHAPYLPGRQNEDRQTAQRWYNYFAEFADSPERNVREWIIINTPIWTTGDSSCESDKALNEQLNQIAASFLADPDKDIAETAEYMLVERDALHLLPKDDTDD